MQFNIHWNNRKKPEVIEGSNIADALINSGYKMTDVRRLKSYNPFIKRYDGNTIKAKHFGAAKKEKGCSKI